jgi:hypothetical protein
MTSPDDVLVEYAKVVEENGFSVGTMLEFMKLHPEHEDALRRYSEVHLKHVSEDTMEVTFRPIKAVDKINISVTLPAKAKMNTPKSHFLIRFNTKHDGTDLKWRLIQDGVEKLVTDVKINARVYTETSQEWGETKYNIACDGYLTIDVNGVAHIDKWPDAPLSKSHSELVP